MSLSTAHLVRIFSLHGERRQQSLIHRLGPQSLPALIEICDGHYPPSVVRWAMEALGGMPGPEAIPWIRRGLQHPAMSVRLHAMLGVRQRADPALARYLKPLLRDVSGGIRVNALAIAAAWRPRWLGAALRQALQDDKAYVRLLAAQLQAAARTARPRRSPVTRSRIR